jgi:hypothetical protein
MRKDLPGHISQLLRLVPVLVRLEDVGDGRTHQAQAFAVALAEGVEATAVDRVVQHLENGVGIAVLQLREAVQHRVAESHVLDVLVERQVAFQVEARQRPLRVDHRLPARQRLRRQRMPFGNAARGGGQIAQGRIILRPRARICGRFPFFDELGLQVAGLNGFRVRLDVDQLVQQVEHPLRVLVILQEVERLQQRRADIFVLGMSGELLERLFHVVIRLVRDALREGPQNLLEIEFICHGKYPHCRRMNGFMGSTRSRIMSIN